jgi:hypothetical protein
MRRSFTLSAVAALMVAGSAYAQSVPVATRAELSGPTIDWGTTSPSGSSFTAPAGSGTVTVSTNGTFIGYVAGSGWQGGFTDGDNLLFTYQGSYMQFDFSGAVHGFGTQTWFNYPPSGQLTFSTYLGGVLNGYFAYSTGGGYDCNCDQATFFGAINSGGFDRVVIDATVQDGGNPFEFAINDVTLNEGTIGPVPEPASLLLLGTGITSLAGFVRRRRKSGGSFPKLA